MDCYISEGLYATGLFEGVGKKQSLLVWSEPQLWKLAKKQKGEKINIEHHKKINASLADKMPNI